VIVSVVRRAMVAPAPASQVMRSVVWRSFWEGGGFGGVVQRAARYPAPAMVAARRAGLVWVILGVSAVSCEMCESLSC
jgi:hypothetical protein